MVLCWIIFGIASGVAITSLYFRAEVEIAYEDRDYYKELYEDAKDAL